MKRRTFAGAGLASVGFGAAVSGQRSQLSKQIAWSPETLCGLNIEYRDFWARKPSPKQYQIFRALGCSFVRGLFFCYLQGRWAPWQVDTAVSSITRVTQCKNDASLVEFHCADFTYPIPENDLVVLSQPVRIGSDILPAKSLLNVSGSRKGEFSYDKGMTSPAVVRIRVKEADGPVVLLDNTRILHRNFYRSKSQLRTPIKDYVEAANEWLSQGFSFDHGGWHDNWHDLFSEFGLDNVQPMRVQEWEFFSSQGWDPRKVLISDENEPVWPGHSLLERWTLFESYFAGTLFPTMRSYFPEHTLGFGFPYYCGHEGAKYIKWWPDDSNTILRIHGYLRESGVGMAEANGYSLTEVRNLIAAVEDNARRAKISAVYWQEFGLRLGAPDRSLRLRNLRSVLKEIGWPSAAWSASQTDDYRVAELQDGLWLPRGDAEGAFGE